MSEPTNSSARFLAPIALFAVVIAVFVVAGSSSVEEGIPPSRATTPTSQGGGDSESEAERGKKVYVVQPGDTLSSIAVATGVPVEDLQALNPDVDSQALGSGERLKLR